MLLHSFYSFDYILRLPIKNIPRLIIKAINKKTENLLIQRWITNYETEMSFDEFKDKIMSSNITDNKTDEEVLTEVKDIINTFNKEVS